MKILLLLSLLLMSSTASAYCVHYDYSGRCDQQDKYSQQQQPRYQEPSNPGLKPLPAIPPVGTRSCNWVVINGQWQSVCR